MKICLLTRRFALETGGIGRVSIALRDGLRELGHEVYTVATAEEDLVHYFKYSFFDIRHKIPKDCDVYHAVTPMESIWLPKRKSVATILDIIPITNPDKHGARMGGNPIKYTIGRTCFDIGCRQAARCARVACISEQGKREIEEHYPRSQGKVSVIRLGIRDDLEPKPKPDEVVRIGYLGQLDRRKRIDVLIEDFKRTTLDAELVIAGKGFNEREMWARAMGDRRISLLGYIEDGELLDFYSSIDYLVFPSAIEGYGLPPVEAMACKTPVIVLKDAIIPEEVKSRCIQLDRLEDFFTILQVGWFEQWESQVQSNYHFAKEHSWGETIKAYLALYQDISG